MSALPTHQLFDPRDPVFVVHEGGKLAVHATSELRDAADLSLLYTPGVADVSRAIAVDPTLADIYTSRRNTVAVVSDGTAVLGLGAIGPLAAMPVMEGKAVLFKHFADVDAVPVCMETGTVDEIVEAVARIAPTYGGINLEDISAPRCFEIEARLRDLLDIPVFHDDQHGTAIVVLAALTTALRVVGKRLEDVRIVVSGVGAAGHAIIRLLLAQGAGEIIACGRGGAVHAGQEGMDPFRTWIAEHTNSAKLDGSLKEVLPGADVFIGVSAPNLLTGEDIATMAHDAIVFALANPVPEVDAIAASEHAAVVATGRSDYPNQINNVLVFPGFFRGLLDAGVSDITDEMLIAAATAIADTVDANQLNPIHIIPSVFDPAVAPAVAAAVRRVANPTGGHAD